MNTGSSKTISELIKDKAFELGFDLCGIAQSHPLTKNGNILSEWCREGMNGEMTYLGRDINKRINPEILFPGAKSVIVTGLNYYSEKEQGGGGIPVISRYAYGENYHDVIIAKLTRLLDYITTISPEAEGKAFVDTAPLLEKAWAHEAGLGWQGRHSVLINDKIGSFFFLGVIVLNLELEYDKPFEEDKCGICRMCIESCPTDAINDNRTLNVNKCIAYQTLESKAPVPDNVAKNMEGRVYGCDKCQEVCPWNKIAKQNDTPEFQLPDEIRKMSSADWFNMTEAQFNILFKRSTVKRGKFIRLKRNLKSAFNLPDTPHFRF